jgi:ankyrin repeat protein
MGIPVRTHAVIRWILAILAAVSAVTAEDNLLIEAAKSRDLATVRALLRQGVSANSRYADGASALHWAAYWGDVETADLLIGAGADVNATDDLGVMPLLLAAKTGNAAMVQKLLAAGANANAALQSGETPLMLAARSGNVEAVQALLGRDATVNAKEKTRGQTALMWAAAEKHTGVARLLIEYGAEVNARSSGRYTPLLFSARANDIDTARILLATGAHIEDGDADGNSPLVVATLMGNTEMVKFLVEKGANVNASGGGFTALHWAVGFWDLGFTGPYGVKAEDSEWSRLAGLRGDAKLEFASFLVDHGADINAKLTKGPRRGGLGGGGTINLSLAGATPLLLAANAADIHLMRLLLEHGADAHVKLNNGTTMLMLAVGITRALGASWVTENQAMEAARLALELGADVNAANVTGDTAMHAAAYSGYNTIVPFLMEKGASLNPKNRQGNTPFLIANGQGPRVAGDNPYQPATAALLRKLGADTTGACEWPCLKASDGEKPVGDYGADRPGRQ